MPNSELIGDRHQMASNHTISRSVTASMPTAASSQDNPNYAPLTSDLDDPHADGTISKFTKFSKLPAELRIKVWKYACCVTRNLVLQLKELSHYETVQDYSPYYFFSACPPPSVLGVCQESRKEGLKHYRLDFEVCETWDMKRGRMTYESPATIYINWSVDRVCLFELGDFEARMRSADDTDRIGALRQRFHERKLRYLACELDYSDDPSFCHSRYQRNLFPLSLLSRDSQYLEEVILFHGLDILDLDYIYSTNRMLQFGNVSEDKKWTFDQPVDELCTLLYSFYGNQEKMDLPPMPFDVRCATLFFDHGLENGRKAAARKQMPNDKGNGTAVALKGETWTYERLNYTDDIDEDYELASTASVSSGFPF